jgi:lysophospholipase L1-like esterase
LPYTPADDPSSEAWGIGEFCFQDAPKAIPAVNVGAGTAPGDPILNIPDWIAGRDLVQRNAAGGFVLAAAPGGRRVARCNGDKGLNNVLRSAFTISQPWTLFAVVRIRRWLEFDYLFDGLPVHTGSVFLRGGSLSVQAYAGNSGPTATVPLDAFVILVFSWSGPDTTVSVNGTASSPAEAGSASPNGFTLFNAGGEVDQPYSCAADLAEYSIHRTADLTPTNYAKLVAHYNDGWPIGQPGIRDKFCICIGDSRTFGHKQADPSVQSWPGQMQAALPAWTVMNFGLTGATTGSILATLSASVAPCFDAGRSKNVAVVCLGPNDFYNGASVADVYNGIVAVCQASSTIGYDVVVQTIGPWSTLGSVPAPAGYEANRVNLNQLLRDHFGEFASRLSDPASDPDIGQANSADPPTGNYFPDGIHETVQGCTILYTYPMAQVVSL